ncbi:PREDICTED: alpha-1B-glycoprotein [Colobus angolensis palliatus]|uniref:alpha-1B-glycoprotein n=1 Tax=Colobus angolensis palliatus TaxID=336983 RepID=UPI0005F43CA6|nr:PREDICTED: alpha-1B-glycoprotein [Colobus angolensis palliatus]
MSMLVAFLVLWGLPVGLVTEAATFYETQPSLWAESASLLKPSANVMLTCQARLATPDFQLFKNGVAQESVHLDSPAIKHQFLLTGDTRGRYRCRSGLFTRWSQLSKLLELTGPKSLPPPWLSMTPVSWITPGLNTTAVCRGGLLGVTFLLRREGDHEFLEMPEAQEDVEAAFPVHRAGNYSCSYRTHVAGTLSEPSATVIIEQLAAPPPPALMHHGESAQVLRPGDKVTLTCVAPLSGVHFQLRRGEKELLVPGSSTSPDRIFFHLNPVALGDGGHYTCRYRLHDNENAWSGDSTPVELILSDETLPAPEFTAEPASRNPAPARASRRTADVLLPSPAVPSSVCPSDVLIDVTRTQSPGEPESTAGAARRGRRSRLRSGTRQREDEAGAEAQVQARPGVWRGPNTCPLRPGPAPRPQLRAAWSGAVLAGRDAVLRCEGPIPDVTFELLREGETQAVETVRTPEAAANLELTFVGPQHAGSYRCRYRSWGPNTFQSELSDPVELLVAGDVSLGPVRWRLPGLCPPPGGPLPAPPLGTVVSAGSPQGSWGNRGRGSAQQRRCSWRRRWGSRLAAHHALPSRGRQGGRP